MIVSGIGQYFFFKLFYIIIIRPRGQLSLPWSVVVETVSAVPGVVIGDEFLIGGYSGPGLLCGRTYEKTQEVL